MKPTPLPKLLAKAQKIFNRWIVERDRDKGCISCNGPVNQAGHYFSQGQHSALRFNEMNVNGQESSCNLYKHGNLIKYRQGLIQRYGEDKVLMLEDAARKPFKKWSRFELEAIIQQYKL